VNAGQDDLLRAAIQRGLDVEQDIRHGAAASLAARDGGDAERAVVVATVLHFDEGARAAVQTGQGLAGDGFEVEGWKIENIFNEVILAVIWDDASHARQFEGFLRLESRPAAGGDDLLHARPGDAADDAARIGAALDVTAQVLTTAMSAESGEATISCPAARNPRAMLSISLWLRRQPMVSR
jgi:hypothetical protein